MIEIEVEDAAWSQALPEVEAVVRRAAEAALIAGEASHGASLTVLLTDDGAVQDLNARFRGKDKATNVLSFPAAASAAPYLGDVAMAFRTCEAEARCQHKSIADHLSHLTVHGVLHLLGYDHEADGEAEVMEDMERQILKRMGVKDPYAWTADA